MVDSKLDTLLEEHQELFSEHFYFECNEGWYAILQTLCAYIDHAIKNSAEEENWDNFKVVQVKEKFGTLRFYTTGIPSEYVRGAIHYAELFSGTVCELCGHPGTRRNLGAWILTRCDSCA